MTKARLALLAIALLAALPVAAQDSTPVSTPISTQQSKIADDPLTADLLLAPRHIFMDDTDVYIVEAGQGGGVPAESPFGIAMTGTTGQITRLTEDGTSEPFIAGLFSSMSETGEVTGPHAIHKSDDAIWVVVGQGVPDLPPETPAWALLQYSADGTTLEQTIDLLEYEETINPDGGEIDSNPVDLAVGSDGAIYVADAGANDILKIVDGEISTFAVWMPVEGEPQSVPTAVKLDAEGNVYVGFLTGFPFPVGGAWIEVLDSNGTSIKRYDGLTMVTAIDLTDDGTLYAVEFGQFTEEGPVPGSGRIMRVTDEGIEPIVTGLEFPYGIAALDDGSFLVTNGASFAASSELLHVHEGDSFIVDAAPAPASEVTEMPDPTATEEP